MCVPFLCEKNACLNYREFDLEGDLLGVPCRWYLSAQSFITLLKLVWRAYDIVAMNEWKKKCVGLQRTWVCKRTVYSCTGVHEPGFYTAVAPRSPKREMAAKNVLHGKSRRLCIILYMQRRPPRILLRTREKSHSRRRAVSFGTFLNAL